MYGRESSAIHSVAKVCHRCGKSLPQVWQKSATGVAKVCHRRGRSLPKAWQKFAKGVAEVCQRRGKVLSKAGQSLVCFIKQYSFNQLLVNPHFSFFVYIITFVGEIKARTL
jgi:DNA-directed RNA polymerase subunit N (RpoN/RPB10)